VATFVAVCKATVVNMAAMVNELPMIYSLL